MSYLVDTNVLSEIRKPSPDENVAAWFDAVEPGEIYLSVLVVGEIQQGIVRLARRDAAQARVFEQWLTQLQQQYRDRILPISSEAAKEWGRINVPDPIPVIDGLMAATAKVHDCIFVTRNIKDVKDTRIRLLNPFKPLD